MNVSYPGVYVQELATGAHPIEGVSTSTQQVAYPGVYLEEIDTGAHPIEGVSTSTQQVAYPGVYLEEIDTGTHPIDGVPTPTGPSHGAARAHTPDWTNPRQGDPGVTLLQLFAFLGESLVFRMNQVPEDKPRSLTDAAPLDGQRSVLWRKPDL